MSDTRKPFNYKVLHITIVALTFITILNIILESVEINGFDIKLFAFSTIAVCIMIILFFLSKRLNLFLINIFGALPYLGFSFFYLAAVFIMNTPAGALSDIGTYPYLFALFGSIFMIVFLCVNHHKTMKAYNTPQKKTHIKQE